MISTMVEALQVFVQGWGGILLGTVMAVRLIYIMALLKTLPTK